jgi:hypothetical protein
MDSEDKEEDNILKAAQTDPDESMLRDLGK